VIRLLIGEVVRVAFPYPYFLLKLSLSVIKKRELPHLCRKNLQIYKMRNIFHKLAFDEQGNLNDVKSLSGNLHIRSLFGSKLDGKQFKGYPCHSNTLKLSGKQFGPPEISQFLIISALRFFIFPKAFQSSVSTSLYIEISRHRISIILVPC